MVAATTTLAEGVDLPFRVTVIADWLLWTDLAPDPRPISAALFANIAGRAGRGWFVHQTETQSSSTIRSEPLSNRPARRASGLSACVLLG